MASVSLRRLLTGEPIPAGADQWISGRLHLPEYQRPYRWSSEQVAQLADDLARHRQLAPDHDYYLDSLILHQSEDGWLDIIDGHQRLTSIGIIGLLAGVSPLPDLSYRAPESRRPQ